MVSSAGVNTQNSDALAAAQKNSALQNEPALSLSMSLGTSSGTVLNAIPATADKLTSTPGLSDKLIPRTASNPSTAEKLIAYNSPLDKLVQGGAARLKSAVNPADSGPTVALGNKGPDVKALQRALQRAGYSPGKADSDFGPATLDAVQKFQQDRITLLESYLGGNLPMRERANFQVTQARLQTEMNNRQAGPETRLQLDQVIRAGIPGNIPVNTNLNVGSDGFINNDPRIVANRVPELEQGAFNDPVGDIDNVVLHRTVTADAQGALNSFATPRGSNDTHYGTHFLIGKDGTIQQTASLNNKTYHVAGHNSSSIGIEVVGMPLDAQGNTTHGPPNGLPVASWEALTPEQVQSVAYLTNSLNDHYGLGSDSVEIHEDLQAKTVGEGGTVYDAIQHLLAPP